MNNIASAILASVASGGRTGGSLPGSNAVAVPASPTPAPAPAPKAPVVHLEAGQEALEAAVKQIREFIKSSPASLEFSIDQGSGHVLLRIMDSQTKELILQVPSQEVLAIARALDRFEGLFLKQKA